MSEQDVILACEALLISFSKPTVPDVEPIVRAYYALPGNGAGGSLHVVLDDVNTADTFVRYCIEEARLSKDPAGEALGQVLLRMSRTQRGKLAHRAY